MSLFLRSLDFVILLLYLPHLVYSTCYTPSGADRNAQLNATIAYEYYAPCDNVAKFSMCCAIGAERQTVYPNVCLPNGLCNSTVDGVFWRESCTDPSWKSEACVKLFINGSNADTDVSVTPCKDGSFCIGVDESAKLCCKAREGVFVVNGTQTQHNPNATSSAKSSHGLSTGTKTGIGVGVGVGVLIALIAVLVVFLVVSRKQRKVKVPKELDASPATTPNNLGPSPLYEISSRQVYQLDDTPPQKPPRFSELE